MILSGFVDLPLASANTLPLEAFEKEPLLFGKGSSGGGTSSSSSERDASRDDFAIGSVIGGGGVGLLFSAGAYSSSGVCPQHLPPTGPPQESVTDQNFLQIWHRSPASTPAGQATMAAKKLREHTCVLER